MLALGVTNHRDALGGTFHEDALGGTFHEDALGEMVGLGARWRGPWFGPRHVRARDKSRREERSDDRETQSVGEDVALAS